MNYVLFVTILVVVLSFLTQIYNTVYPRFISNKLMQYLENNDLDAFDELYNRRSGILSDFDNKFLLLNKAFLQADEKQIRSRLDEIVGTRMNEIQQAQVYSKAFYFYLSIQEYSQCKKYYELLKNNEQYEDYHNLDIVYDVYIEKGTKYLDELLNRPQTPMTLSLLSAIYTNAENKEKAEEYEALLASILKEKIGNKE